MRPARCWDHNLGPRYCPQSALEHSPTLSVDKQIISLKENIRQCFSSEINISNSEINDTLKVVSTIALKIICFDINESKTLQYILWGGQ